MTPVQMGVRLVVVPVAMAVGLAGCTKAPPDHKALYTLAMRDAPATLRQTGSSRGDAFEPKKVCIAKGGSPATVVMPVEFRQRLDVESPMPEIPVYQTTSKAYLVVEYKWTGKRWKRIKADVMDECPWPLPESFRHDQGTG